MRVFQAYLKIARKVKVCKIMLAHSVSALGSFARLEDKLVCRRPTFLINPSTHPRLSYRHTALIGPLNLAAEFVETSLLG